MHLRFSQDLQILLNQLADHPLTLKDIINETSERGFSLIIGLLVLPFLFPMPPGLPLIFGSASGLLGLQMAMGKRKPWLPERIAKVQFPKKLGRELLNGIKKGTRLLERITRPRFLELANHPLAWKVNGFCIAWLALLLMLPFPFTNPFPTLGILILVIATLETDGLLMCLGYIWSFGVTLIFMFIFYLLWKSPELLLNGS